MKNYYAIAMEKMKGAIPWGPGKTPGWDNLFTKKDANGRFGPDKVALKAAQDTRKKQAAEFLKKTEIEINAILPQVSPQVLAVIGGKPERKEEHDDKTHAHNLSIFLEKIQDAVAAGPASPVVSKPITAPAAMPTAVAPASVAQPAPTPKVTAEGLGRTVNALLTNQDPAVREPIMQGLQQSLAASAKPRPDFSFLHGMERTRIAAEFDRLGGLTEQSHKLFMYRRRAWIMENKVLPEQVTGTATILPEMISKEVMKQREQAAAADRNLPGLKSLFHSINSKIVALHQSRPGSFDPNGRTAEARKLMNDRSEILARLNAAEKTLGFTLTK